MKLHCINLAGVLLLLGISIAGWRQNRALNLDINRLEEQTMTQNNKIADQEKSLREAASDLNEFKQQLGRAEIELQGDRAKLLESDRKAVQLTSERDQLKSNVTNWANAVAARDARIGELGEQSRALTEKLNESTGKFNALATNYNLVVKELNELRAHITATNANHTP